MRGQVIFRKQFIPCGTSAGGSISGLGAHALGDDIIGHGKPFRRQIFMDLLHDRIPQFFLVGVADAFRREHIVVVVAAPDTAGVVGGVAGKPDITVAGGGSGLAGSVHFPQIDLTVGGAFRVRDDAAHGVSQEIGSRGLQDAFCLEGGGIQKHFSIRAEDLGIEFRSAPGTSVRDTCVRIAQLQIGHSVGDAAKSQSRHNIAEGLLICDIVIDQ